MPWIPKQIILDQSVVDNKVHNKIEEQYLSEKCSAHRMFMTEIIGHDINV